MEWRAYISNGLALSKTPVAVFHSPKVAEVCEETVQMPSKSNPIKELGELGELGYFSISFPFG